jgi:hypothetical protein
LFVRSATGTARIVMDLGSVFRRLSGVLLLSDTPYMLTGSFASSYYGVLRGTQDIDIVVAPSPQQFHQLLSQLKASDYYTDSFALTAYREQSMFNAIDNESGWKVDFIFCKARPYSEEAFRRRKSVTFQGVPFFVSTAEDVVLAKLEWSKMSESRRQFEDAANVLKKQQESLDFEYLERWATSLGIGDEFKSARKFADQQ